MASPWEGSGFPGVRGWSAGERGTEERLAPLNPAAFAREEHLQPGGKIKRCPLCEPRLRYRTKRKPAREGERSRGPEVMSTTGQSFREHRRKVVEGDGLGRERP